MGCTETNRNSIQTTENIDYEFLTKNKTDTEEKETQNKETIFWVDQNIKNDENQDYCYKLNNKHNIIVKQFTDLNSLFEKLKLIKFDIVIIIISGKLIGDYLTLFKEQMDSLYIIPIHIIFTNHKDIIIDLLKNKYSEDLKNDLINIENVTSSFEEVKNLVINYIKDDKLDIEIDNLDKPTDYNYCFNFEYIEKSEDLICPYLYQKIMENTKVDHSEINEFNQFLLKNFGLNENINELINKLIKVGKISDKIIAKFWARVYTFESPFYSNLNWNLMKLQNKQYNSYIQLLYSKLKDYSYRDKANLFRGGIISNDEFNKIQKILKYKKMKPDSQKKVLIYSRTFLSFSESEFIAKNYLEDKQGFKTVLFEIENNFYNNENYSNINMESFTVNKREKEILFFPFSSFVVKKIIGEKCNM